MSSFKKYFPEEFHKNGLGTSQISQHLKGVLDYFSERLREDKPPIVTQPDAQCTRNDNSSYSYVEKRMDVVIQLCLHRFNLVCSRSYANNRVDKTLDERYQGDFEEFLNSLNPKGLSPHKLLLKFNCPIILFRNLNPTERLCNKTRLICRELRQCIIASEIAFEPVFSHGQLYVALSRARTAQTITVLIIPPILMKKNNAKTCNVVYEKVFLLTQVRRNKKLIHDYVIGKVTNQHTHNVVIPVYDNFTLVANILPSQKAALVKAKINFKKIVQKYYYMAYKNCRFEGNLSDESGVIITTLFRQTAKQILGLTTAEAMKTPSKKHIDDIPSSLETKEYIIQIKSSKQNDRGSQKYSIVYCLEYENVKKSSKLLPICDGSAAASSKEQSLDSP
ncbi:DNA helicase Pif1-like [Dillenia turbinata]|uniref:DNA helicase Pif1-like n=1 Tax=Dillenia turbinata TaxID=194707 RepID=A0AAN8YWJ9_9MAGN